MAVLDWFALWRQLAADTLAHVKKERILERYKVHSRKKVERRDPLLDFVLQKIDRNATIIDIGAGSGRWTIPLSKKAKKITAIEPSKEMRNLLSKKINSAHLNNVQIVPTNWEEAVVEPHDVTVCAHAIYSSPDFALFIRKMEQHSKKKCFLSLRLPPYNGIIGHLCNLIYGYPYDSPNAMIAYNALYSLGIQANVLVEKGIKHWKNSTLEDAFARAKRHLKAESFDIHDKLIRDTLSQNLKYIDDSYIWPDGMRSALLWWKPAPSFQ